MTHFWQIIRTPALILIGATVISLPFWLLGWDAELAKLTHQPDSPWAHFFRQYAQVPLLLASLVFLVILLIPPVRKKFPVIRQLSAVWWLTMLLAGGLLNQVIVQDLVDRPRPRETVLLEDASAVAALGGHSFPSGHAVIGFMLAVPAFIYWRRRPGVAYRFLAAGTAVGFAIGYARMQLGAHYFTDILWAGALLYAGAALFTRLLPSSRDVPTWISAGLVLLAIWAIVWWNAFTLKLTHEVQAVDASISIPCATFTFRGAPAGSVVDLYVKGYGAPLSNLMLQEQDGHVSLQRWRGIYRDLDCRVVLQTP